METRAIKLKLFNTMCRMVWICVPTYLGKSDLW